MTDASMFDWGVMRESVHELDYGHKQAAATASVVAGGFEAGDRSGDVDARIIGLGGGAALRRQRQPVFAWRRRYRGAAAEPAGLQLMPVTVMPDGPVGAASAGASELIEIVLNGYRVRVGDGIKASTLRLVLDVLERR
jgi:hypothetical protein